MAGVAKFFTGLLLVILMTYGQFYVRGQGEWTINDLTRRANQALVDHNVLGVTVAFEANPVRRVAHLEGELPPEQQAAAIRTVRQVPGVAEAVWGPAGV